MSDRDNITLPREVVEKIFDAFSSEVYPPAVSTEWYDIMDAFRTALAAPRLEVTVDPRLTPDEAAAISSALAAPRQKPEPVAYFDLQKQVFFWAKPTMIDVPMTVALNPLPLYAAPPAAAPEPMRHPGYIIGNHWLETAYERLCAGEAEDAILEDYELVREPRLRDLRRNAERYRWLLEQAWFQFEFDGRYGDSGETVQQLDAAIGAAMKEDGT